MTTKAPYIPALRYRWLTGAYDVIISATTRERTFKQRLIDQAGIAAGQEVLDLGCGTGTLAIWAAERSPEARITGVDGDDAVLDRARRKAQRHRCLIGMPRRRDPHGTLPGDRDVGNRNNRPQRAPPAAESAGTTFGCVQSMIVEKRAGRQCVDDVA